LMRAIFGALALAALLAGADDARAQSADATLSGIVIFSEITEEELVEIQFRADAAAGCAAAGSVHTCNDAARAVSVTLPYAGSGLVEIQYSGNGDIAGSVETPAQTSPALPGITAFDGFLDEGTESFPLSSGDTRVLTLSVEASGKTTTVYTLSITRAAGSGSDATLSHIFFIGSPPGRPKLDPKFGPGTETYTGAVEGRVTSMEVIPYATDLARASITVGGNALLGDVPEQSIHVPLSPGANVIPVVVTAADGSTTKTYTFTITRNVSFNTKLSALSLSDGVALNPVFSGDTSLYQMRVPNNVASIAITPSAQDVAGTTIHVKGDEVTSGQPSSRIALDVGETKIRVTVTVTAQPSISKIILLIFTRLSANADLSGLALSDSAVLSTQFAAGTISYTASVANSVDNITVTPVASDSNAMVTVNGNTPDTAVALPSGAPTDIAVVVAAEDRSITKTYTVTVTRGASANADLSGLALSGDAVLSTQFAPGTFSYTATVESDIGSVRITPMLAEPNAMLAINGVTQPSAEIPLVLDVPKEIVVVVTAQDGAATKTYAVTVTRMRSNDATLSGLAVSGGQLALAAATTRYAVAVPNATTSVSITATSAHERASFTLQIGAAAAAAGTSGVASAPAAIAEGASITFTIVVTAEDGAAMQTYIVVVTRMTAPPDAPTGLVVTPGKDTFSLEWSAPAETHGAPITGYRVRWGTSSWSVNLGNGSGSEGVPTGSADTAWTVPAARILAPQLGYRLAVAAVNSAGTGAWTPINMDNRVNPRLPAAPQNISATTPGATSLALRWDATPGASGYQVRWKTDAESAYGNALDVSAATHTLSGLSGGVTYDVQVAAVNAEGRGAWTSATFSLVSDPSNAELARLRFHDGARPLSPPFASATTAYSLNVPNRIAAAAVTPFAADFGARIMVKVGAAAPATVESGMPSALGSLVADADFVFGIVVTAANGNVTKTYALTVNRTSLRFAAQQDELVFLAGKPLTAVALPEATGGMAPYTYAASGLPQGLSFDKDRREISGAPGESASQAQIRYTVTDAASRSDAQDVTIRTVTFDLDLDAGGANANDGIITARYLLGVRGEFLVQGQAAPGSAAALEAELKNGVDSLALDVDGNGEVNGDDGIFTARYLLGLRGEDLVGGFDGKTAADIERNIAGLLP